MDMEKWPEERIEAYKHYVKTDMQALEGYENQIKSLQKKLQDLEKQKERKMSQVEKQIFQLYNQGWEMKYGVWVEVNKQ
ncbi:hypothetical protein K7H05_00885 [Bacillus sp. ZZQ-131]|nr:hypothetical protein [Bacillus thuringiensis]MRC49064.1 hypothetical protein [Bacillus thuringiensis]MRD27340.1 hypothetical protein [Bacillus thuringiensis]